MTAPRLDDYAEIFDSERNAVLRRLARRLEGLRLVVVNSTRVGGGVAEMLNRHVPLFGELGIETRCEILQGTPEFFNRPGLADEMGARGRQLVRHHFLLTRHLRDWLTLFLAITHRAA